MLDMQVLFLLRNFFVSFLSFSLYVFPFFVKLVRLRKSSAIKIEESRRESWGLVPGKYFSTSGSKFELTCEDSKMVGELIWSLSISECCGDLE